MALNLKYKKCSRTQQISISNFTNFQVNECLPFLLWSPLKLLHSSFNFLKRKLNNFYHRFVAAAETTGRDRFQVSSADSEFAILFLDRSGKCRLLSLLACEF